MGGGLNSERGGAGGDGTAGGIIAGGDGIGLKMREGVGEGNGAGGERVEDDGDWMWGVAVAGV